MTGNSTWTLPIGSWGPLHNCRISRRPFTRVCLSVSAETRIEACIVGDSANRIWHQRDRERAKQLRPATATSEAAESTDPSSAVQLESGREVGIHVVHSAPRKGQKGDPPWPTAAGTFLLRRDHHAQGIIP